MNILQASKNMCIQHNVLFRVLDATTGQVVKEYKGHNQATNSMLMGIAHYLKGDGILNQGNSMLGTFIPRYISLGTMGLMSQEEDAEGLPAGIGISSTKQPDESDEDFEIRRFEEYMNHRPGYGADGYDENQNNGRGHLGLGPCYDVELHPINCELISSTFPRTAITYREIVPEAEAELPETIDVIFSAMISTGALKQFRDPANGYIFITEAGLWSQKNYSDKAPNGLLAGYRIVPPDETNWYMQANPALEITPEQAALNRRLLKQQIIKVNTNQVVQVIWKIQIGAREQFGAIINKHCDCTCYDKSHPNPECPCHGNKEKKTILYLNKHNIELNVGESESLIATVDPIQPVTWTSNDESIAIYEDGIVKALADGTTTITATATDGSDASDSCIVSTHVNVPVGDLESYTLFSTATLILGARTVIYGDNIGIGKKIDWQASDYKTNEGRIVGYSENSKLYVWCDNTSTGGDAAIVSRGGNYFDIAVYMPKNASVSLSNQPNTEELAFLRGRYEITEEMERPKIELLNESDYIPGNNNINIGQNELALMTEENVIFLQHAIGYSYVFKDNVFQDYIYSRTVNSTNSEYGAYRQITFDSSENRPASLYVYPGKYAIAGLSQTGNFTQFRFKGSTQSESTVFYVRGNISLSNDTHISNDGEAKSCMVYCTGNLSAGATKEMKLYLVAPNGKVTISNSNEHIPITLYGNIYANEIELGNNIHFGIMEV